MVGRERDWKLWNKYESEEVWHEFFEWYGWFEFGQRRTGNPGRQGGSEMERHPPRHPLPCPGRSRSGEARGLGRVQGWDTRESLPRRTLGASVGRKGGAALLEAQPRHPLRNSDHRSLAGEDGRRPGREATFWQQLPARAFAPRGREKGAPRRPKSPASDQAVPQAARR